MRVENLIATTPRIFNADKAESTNTSLNFGDVLKDVISEARNLREKDIVNNNLLTANEAESLDDVMIDMEKADIALQFTMQVRNKILDAYQEIMRMQI